MNKIPNRKAICDVLLKEAETDKDIVVLCSDSRGSASLAPFADAYPEQFVEMGIAEQDRCCILQHKCKTYRNQWWNQLRCSWNEPSFRTGYRRYVRNPQHESLSSK